MRFRLFWVSAAMVVGAALPASAQNVIGAKSGVINWVEGDVYLNSQPYTMQHSQFGEVKENGVLRTGAGRAEVLLPPGVFFRLAENSSFRMISNRLIDTRVELLAGSGIIEIDDLGKGAPVTIVAKDGTVKLDKAGLYRFDTQPAQLKVFKGTATVEMRGDNVSVSAGKMVNLTGVAAVEKFNAEDTDSFDHWSRRRGEELAQANISAAKQAGYAGGSAGYAGSGGYGGLGVGLGGYGSGMLYGGMNPCYSPGYMGGAGYVQPWGTWGYNPYYGFGTYVPCSGMFYSPYGYAFFSPMMAYRGFYGPNPLYTFPRSGQLGTNSVLARTPEARRGFGAGAPFSAGAASYSAREGSSGAVSRGGGMSGGGFGSGAGSMGSPSAGHGGAGGGHR